MSSFVEEISATDGWTYYIIQLPISDVTKTLLNFIQSWQRSGTHVYDDCARRDRLI